MLGRRPRPPRAAEIEHGLNERIGELWAPAQALYRPWHVKEPTEDLHLVAWAARDRIYPMAWAIRDEILSRAPRCSMLVDPLDGRIDIQVPEMGEKPATIVAPLQVPVARHAGFLEVYSSPLAGQWLGQDTPAMKAIRDNLKARFDPDNVLPHGWGAPFRRGA